MPQAVIASRGASWLWRAPLLLACSAAFGSAPLEPKPTVVLQRVAVPQTDRQLGMGIAEFPPNSAMRRKKAVGPEVCYVLQGEVTITFDGQPPRTFRAGQSFQIPANAVHVTSAGSAGAKVLAAWVLTPGKPFNIFVAQ
jgi:quercetin dioxygenase-like cupin family protein